MHRRPQHPRRRRPVAAVGGSPWAGGHGETTDDPAGRRRARDRGGLRGADVVGTGPADRADAGGRVAGRGGACGGAAAAGDRAARDRRLPARVLRRRVGGRGWERVRHPQRRARGVADRCGARCATAVPRGQRNPARPLHRAPRGLRARPGDERPGADRPRGRAGGRLAQGCRGLALGTRPGVRERPGEPGADVGCAQPGQERLGRLAVVAAEPGVPLRVRGAAGAGQGGVRPRDHLRGVRRARRCAGHVPRGAGRRGGDVSGRR